MHPDFRELPILDKIYILGIAIHSLQGKDIKRVGAQTATLIKLLPSSFLVDSEVSVSQIRPVKAMQYYRKRQNGVQSIFEHKNLSCVENSHSARQVYLCTYHILHRLQQLVMEGGRCIVRHARSVHCLLFLLFVTRNSGTVLCRVVVILCHGSTFWRR